MKVLLWKGYVTFNCKLSFMNNHYFTQVKSKQIFKFLTFSIVLTTWLLEYVNHKYSVHQSILPIMAHLFLDQTSQTRCYVADVSQVKTILPKSTTVDGTATASNALCFDIEFPDAVLHCWKYCHDVTAVQLYAIGRIFYCFIVLFYNFKVFFASISAIHKSTCF